MKKLNTPYMNKLLKNGVKKSKRMKPPKEGTMISLKCFDNPSGFHYQVDWIKDSRVYKNPYIVVYAFKPGGHGGYADYYLSNIKRK